MNLAALFVVVRVTESGAPMAKIGGDDKQVLRIGQIFGKDPAVLGLLLHGERAHQDRDDGEPGGALLLHDAGDERQLHLDRVLVLVRLLAHDLELAGVEEVLVNLLVDGEIIERRLVLDAGGHGAATQTDVVRGAQNEDPSDARGIDLIKAINTINLYIKIAAI